MKERMVIAAAVAWCCPEGCAYVEAGRAAECDAMTGGEWLHGKVRAMLEAAAGASAACLPTCTSSHAGTFPPPAPVKTNLPDPDSTNKNGS